MQKHTVAVVVLGWMALLGGCRGASLWNTAAPVNVLTERALNSPQGAYQAYQAAVGQVANAVNGNANGSEVLYWAEMLSDEYSASYLEDYNDPNVDARYTTSVESDSYDCDVLDGEVCGEAGDTPLEFLLQARSAILLTVPYLSANEQGANQGYTGAAEALAGYTELYMAEYYCAGVPLTQAEGGGGVQFGVPLTTDSLLGVAEAHFRAAIAVGAGAKDSTVQYLATVGLGRTLLDRGRYDSAATAVASVPTGFVYDLQYDAAGQSSGALADTFDADNFFYNGPNSCCATIINGLPMLMNSLIMANDEGGVGYNYLTANDPRLALTVLGYSGDGYTVDCCAPGAHLADSLVYWPVKFGATPTQFVSFPIATGIEARMIQAEDTLQKTSGDLYTYLNTLRAAAPSTYIGGGTVPSFGSDTASCGGPGDANCVKTFFREKAFWLYGLGNRLGDMRREERQYHLPDASVYPTGHYGPDPVDSALIQNEAGLTVPWMVYGKDVSLTVPTAAAISNGTVAPTPNPYFTGGCLVGTTTQTP